MAVSKKSASKKKASKKSAVKKILIKKKAAKKVLKKNEYPKVNWREYFPEPVIGVDEVGRGCLAGPVYAAAVIFKSDALSEDVTDSKLISEERREELAELILKEHHVGIGFASVEEIDELNILQASLLAMKRAVEALGVTSGHVLIDGNMKIPKLAGSFEQTTIVKGDLRAPPISAASIVAKVTRDRIMKELSGKYPQYGFEAHKGYSTAIHMESIQAHGPCDVHRKSFSGVKEFVPGYVADPTPTKSE
ncbi:ribonuclease HII [Bdellovibrio reynosensis]|uniref:Ribonuclease HII n=1 Tax=Bdellovibrio reynosensis TaxID=2835041 RepID=A0ABY4CE17_9BACT|nr:ribonuclease HII [Bdellovibrio reynosensis]UOF01921.1 ribonuclease HII [Bdellovibrio reynosensis]